MILRARQNGPVTVFEVEGQLDFESTVQFQRSCESILASKAETRMLFNLEKLRFVGSTGINQFIKAIKDLAPAKQKPKLVGVSSEFERMFRAYGGRPGFELFESEESAITSFSAPPPTKKTNRKIKLKGTC